MSSQKDTIQGTLIVAVLLCFVCSVIVSLSAVSLRPIQARNKVVDIKRNILVISGIAGERKLSAKEIEAEFEKEITPAYVNFETGEITEDPSAAKFDVRAATKDPAFRYEIPAAKDLGGIKARSTKGVIYLQKKGGSIAQLILPIHGKGLWSTLYGFLSLSPDTKTIKGIGFYEHGETPGLGGEVDNPRWKAKWVGKQAYDESFNPAIKVIKGAVTASTADAQHKIDGLSGATITSVGVENFVNYWLGENGYGKMLERMRSVEVVSL